MAVSNISPTGASSTSQPTRPSVPHSQSQSRLFSRLPPEVRHQIFSYACLSYQNTSRSYSRDQHYYRPGFHFFHRIDTALLLTCKRIYSEACYLPLSCNTHTFWIFRGPSHYLKPPTPFPSGPPQRRMFDQITAWRHGSSAHRWDHFINSLPTPIHSTSVQSLHLFIHQSYLEGLGHTSNIPPLSGLDLKHLKITIRDQEWWTCEAPPESSDRLGICPWLSGRVSAQVMESQPLDPSVEWIQAKMLEDEDEEAAAAKEAQIAGRNTTVGMRWGGHICRIKSLQELEMEFEIRRDKRSQLDRVVERAKMWKFPLLSQHDSCTNHNSTDDDNGQNGDVPQTIPYLSLNAPAETSTWTGLKNLRDNWAVSRPRPAVVPSTARARNRTASSAADRREETRDYVVVSMRWTLKC